MISFADSHAHLNDADFEEDLDAVLQRAGEHHVDYINLIATRLTEVNGLVKICQSHPGLHASAGVHPHYAGSAQAVSVAEIVAACDDAKVVAVGETGLDFHYDFSSRETQESVFRNHVRAANAVNLPLVVHTREAEEATRRVLEEEGAAACGGVLHCFTGSAELARWGVEAGFFISFSGILTFRNAEPLRRIAAEVPLDRILIETDAPYLAPVPHRGHRNEPAYVVRVAETLAGLRGVSVEEVARLTTDNFLRLFRLPPLGKTPRHLTLAYSIGTGLYLNISRGCTLHCAFCPKWTAPVVHEYDLTLDRNPTAGEILEAMGDFSSFEEVVFCGFGEPTLRLKVLLEVAAEIKKRREVRVRINTDGLANRVFGEDVTPRFKGLIDSVSVSLNAQDEATYNRHCQPALSGSFAALLDFVRAVRHHVPEVTVTAIDGLDGVDIPTCAKIAQDLGVAFRVRYLNKVG